MPTGCRQMEVAVRAPGGSDRVSSSLLAKQRSGDRLPRARERQSRSFPHPGWFPGGRLLQHRDTRALLLAWQTRLCTQRRPGLMLAGDLDAV